MPLLISSANPGNDGLLVSEMNVDTWIALFELMACSGSPLRSKADLS